MEDLAERVINLGLMTLLFHARWLSIALMAGNVSLFAQSELVPAPVDPVIPVAQATPVAEVTPFAEATPVLRFAVLENAGGAHVTVDGQPFASYVIDQANKPYLWPVYGPGGKAMTRAYPMKETPEEPTKHRDHPHHRGIVFGHESIGTGAWRFPDTAAQWASLTGNEKHFGGGDTWHERATFEEFISQGGKNALRGKQRLPMLASIRHRQFVALRAEPNRAVIEQICDYYDPSGRRFLSEERRLTFSVSGETRIIDFDQDLIASEGDVRFEDRKDAGLSIRVPVTMAVDSKKGGKIVNAEGLEDKEAWGKASPWCDYHGPVEGEHLGIAMLNHPVSYRYPTPWHVRTYGLFTANPFSRFDSLGDATTTVPHGQRIKLRHRFIFHRGDPKSAKIAEAFNAYSAEPR